MSEKAHAEFLFAILRHSSLLKYDLRQLADHLQITPAATSMRITRLKRKLAKPTPDIEGKDIVLLEKLVEFSGIKPDIRGLAKELGLKPSAVSMRLTRVRKKLGAAAQEETSSYVLRVKR
jgi:DNA-binding MarR family transcriptional regulator